MAPTYKFTAKEVLRQGRVPKETFDKLRKWSKTQPLPFLSDEQLILFLLSCLNDLDATKHTIHSYFKCKNEAPEIFDNKSIEADAVQKVIKVCDFAILPIRTAKNEAIVTWRLRDTCYYKLHLEAAMKMLIMVGEFTLYQDPPDGLVVLMDLKGVGLLHLTRLRVGPLKHFFHYIQEGIPCKLRHIHVLNTVYFIDKVMKILKPFMKEELYNMIQFHSPHMKMEEFFEKYLPVECMPEDYGGSLAKVDVLCSQTYEALRFADEIYKAEEEQYKSYRKT